MSETQVKAAVSKFMQHVTPTALREIEKAVRNALANGTLVNPHDLNAAVTLSSEQVGLNITIHSRIVL